LIPTTEQIAREAQLLTIWAELGSGYSKTFRVTWAEKNIKERLEWLEDLVKSARYEKAVMEGC